MRASSKPIRIFFDTEFTGLNLAVDAKLISIGLVSQCRDTKLDGRTFYAELSDTWHESDCSDFVRETVLPHLEGSRAAMEWAAVAIALRQWIEAFSRPVVLMTDSPTYDGWWIEQLFHFAGHPANLNARVRPISFSGAVLRRRFTEAVKAAFASGLRRHHALDDARANRMAWIAAHEN